MTDHLRPDELQAQAARAMLAALKHLLEVFEEAFPTLARLEVDPIKGARAAIAQAEAAGLKEEG